MLKRFARGLIWGVHRPKRGILPDEARARRRLCYKRLDEKTLRSVSQAMEGSMPRYLVERTFPDGLTIPMTEEGAITCLNVVNNNAEDTVTWVHSYVTDDKAKTYCIYDAPSPEAIRRAARRNNLPVDKITEVRVLDPYFYR